MSGINISNPFKDIDQPVVIRPSNSPGPQGPAAPEVKIQYSIDTTSWHDVPAENDMYIRFSTNDGRSWGEPLLISNLAGSVIGPESSVDGNIAVFDGATGKVIKDAGFEPIKGPESSVDGNIAVFDGATGKVIKDAGFEPIKGPDTSIDGGIAVFDGTDGKALKVAGSKLSSCYERGSIPSIKGTLTAADRYTWVSPAGGLNVGINGDIYTLTGQVELNLNNSASWDSISPNYTIAANRAGKDFYVYACQPQDGYAPVLILSTNSTYPIGYTADTSRKIGGFHCLCLSVGTISGHPLSGFVTGDILPLSVWDLLHRPKTASPEGMVWCPSANIWVDIYLQSGTGSTTASAYGATITDTRTWMDHVDDLGAVGKRLLDDGEFQKIAAGGNEKTNISGSADPGTTGGHTDTKGRRIISSIGCEDCAGAMWQWLSDQSFHRSDNTAWSWKDLPGGKGNIYAQGTYGDVKLCAGGDWESGANCGSRCRSVVGYRWWATSSNGARGAAEPI
jgi:hypothetical protein